MPEISSKSKKVLVVTADGKRVPGELVERSGKCKKTGAELATVKFEHHSAHPDDGGVVTITSSPRDPEGTRPDSWDFEPAADAAAEKPAAK